MSEPGPFEVNVKGHDVVILDFLDLLLCDLVLFLVEFDDFTVTLFDELLNACLLALNDLVHLVDFSALVSRGPNEEYQIAQKYENQIMKKSDQRA